MIRLLIADDHPLVRAGFRQLVADDRSIQVVAEAVDGHDLLAQLKRVAADVVVLDINMPGPRFLELIERIRTGFPQVRVLVVSVQPEGETAVRALRAGAAGYVTKTQSPVELLAAVKKVHAGGKYVSAALGERLAFEVEAGGPRGRKGTLSDREHQVLVLLGNGRSNKEIAAVSRVSPKTVSTYRNRILRKLGLKTNADIVRYVMENGLTA